jgi:hypothetical protein
MPKEVKHAEVLNLEEKETEEETEEDEDVIPPDPLGEEKKTKSEGEEEEIEEEQEVESESSAGTAPKQPKPVEGETSRERAMRLEIERLRRANREKFIITPEVKQELKDKSIDELKEMGYEDAEIEKMQKAIDILATKSGYVKKSQTYQDTANQLLEDFIEANPEYKPENDRDDIRWSTFDRIIKRDYNLANKTQKQLKSIFDKVNRDVEDELGEVDDSSISKQRNAQTQKIRSVSHSGGTKTAQKSGKTSVDPAVKNFFQGFDDDELV